MLSHGSPFDPLNDYLYDNNPKLLSLEQFEFDIIICGQTHIKNIRKIGNNLFLNPGSVGQSRDKNAIVNAIVYDDEINKVESIQKKYDFAKVISLAKKNGADEWITKHFI